MSAFRNAALRPVDVTAGAATGHLTDTGSGYSARLPGNGSQAAGFHDRGFSLIEVLVTILILMVGLLGLAGLQSRALTAQMEAYQRSQALILLKDMADRIGANRKAAACYAITGADTDVGDTYFGADSSLPVPTVAACAAAIQVNYPAVVTAAATAAATVAAADMNSWHDSLLGAAETQGGAEVGAMIGARGCVYEIAAPATGTPARYMVAVAWQGINSTAVPAIACGTGEYGDETKRRVVTLPVSIADLD